ncbi:MAG TPA: DUF3109 family protein [Bacteroidales bacterium]|nr:DUF3109 family protein [Bacteroidales bacterium]
MIIIGNTLISDEIYTERFVCDLKACMGACCVEGDLGAPLTKEETGILEEVYPRVKPFLLESSIVAIESSGFWVKGLDGDPYTPLVDAGRCAYAYFDENIACCAFEKAWEKGLTDFQKPVSCHLYPIRLTHYKDYDALNYHHWHVCEGAIKRGNELNVPVFRFLKEALVRKYGQEWYDELDAYIKMAFENNPGR